MMGLLNKLMGELVDLIEWLDDTDDTLTYRFERYQNDIKYGANLVVREGQMAAFVNEGRLADVFPPGTYTLVTVNLPILSTLKGWKFGFSSPFKAEVYFCSTRKFADLAWVTPGPATMRDRGVGAVPVTAFGLYAIRIKDAGTFVREMVGTDSRFTIEQIQENLGGKIGLRIKEAMPDLGIPVLEMETKAAELGVRLRERLAPELESLGLGLLEVQGQDVGLRQEVETVVDKRGAMTGIGNLQGDSRYETASAMQDAVDNPGGVTGTAMGLGSAVGMVERVNTMAGITLPSTAATIPPPLPGVISFHVAVNSQQTGPFELAVLQQQAASGQLSRASLVWRAGMAQWAAAGDVPELAPLFANVPPPVPSKA